MTTEPQDAELQAGRYDPDTYWDARARNHEGNTYQAVCVYRCSDALNCAAERTQCRSIRDLLSAVDLKGCAVLEIGCGVGRWIDLIESLGGRYEGADISQEMISIAAGRRPDIRFSHLTGPGLPISDSALDLVFTVTVLHHNPFDRQDRMIEEALRVLRPGGHLLILEAVKPGSRRQVGFNMFPRSAEDWTAAVTLQDRAELVAMRFMRVWLFAMVIDRGLEVLGRAVGRLRPSSRRSDRNGFGRLREVAVRIANAIDMHIQPLLPRAAADCAVFLFRKAAVADGKRSTDPQDRRRSEGHGRHDHWRE